MDAEAEFKLAELAKRSGVSIASIKHYQRTGLLPGPRLLNQTTGRYAERHLTRLLLIRFARERIRLPLPAIGRLCALIDDESVPIGRVLQACQHVAASGRLPAWLEAPDAGEALGDEADAPTAVARTEAARAATRLLDDTCEAIGWANLPEEELAPVADAIAGSIEAGMPPDVPYLERMARALEVIAENNIQPTVLDTSRDSVALYVLRGVTVQNDLLIAFGPLAHVARSTAPTP